MSLVGRITMAEKKRKKEKITYIDDGRTIADMSGISGRMHWTKQGTTSSPKEIWNTYWTAVRMMFKPMLVVIGFLTVIFGIAALAFWLM